MRRRGRGLLGNMSGNVVNKGCVVLLFRCLGSCKYVRLSQVAGMYR